MKAKEYLSQAYKLNNLIDSKLLQLEKSKSLMYGISSISKSSERVSGGKATSDRLGDIVSKTIDLEEEINKTIDNYVDIQREITAMIEAVENPIYRVLLTYRYLDFLTWEKIAKRIGYSYVHTVHRLHPKALAAVEEILKGV